MNVIQPAVPSTPDIADRRRAFGRTVQLRRQRRGLTATQLANISGLDRSAIARLESGASTVTLDDGFALADALGTDLAELLHETRVLVTQQRM